MPETDLVLTRDEDLPESELRKSSPRYPFAGIPSKARIVSPFKDQKGSGKERAAIRGTTGTLGRISETACIGLMSGYIFPLETDQQLATSVQAVIGELLGKIRELGDLKHVSVSAVYEELAVPGRPSNSNQQNLPNDPRLRLILEQVDILTNSNLTRQYQTIEASQTFQYISPHVRYWVSALLAIASHIVDGPFFNNAALIPGMYLYKNGPITQLDGILLSRGTIRHLPHNLPALKSLLDEGRKYVPVETRFHFRVPATVNPKSLLTTKWQDLRDFEDKLARFLLLQHSLFGLNGIRLPSHGIVHYIRSLYKDVFNVIPIDRFLINMWIAVLNRKITQKEATTNEIAQIRKLLIILKKFSKEYESNPPSPGNVLANIRADVDSSNNLTLIEHSRAINFFTR